MKSEKQKVWVISWKAHGTIRVEADSPLGAIHQFEKRCRGVPALLTLGSTELVHAEPVLETE